MQAGYDLNLGRAIRAARIASPGSALGEAVGLLIESEVVSAVRQVAGQLGFYADTGGPRPERRRGVQLTLANGVGNRYQLDCVVEDAEGRPVIIVESKYLRYKKHNRDKASWLCSAHYSLRKEHPSIRKSLAILSGNWSEPSKRFIGSFGIEIHEVPFATIVSTLNRYGIAFAWDEKDRATAASSWNAFCQLPKRDLRAIAEDTTKDVRPAVVASVEHTLAADLTRLKEVTEVEVLLKTSYDEFFASRFETVTGAIKYLLDLQMDKPDTREVLTGGRSG